MTWLRDRCSVEGLSDDAGVALVATLAILALVSAIALGLALTTSLEPAIASAHESSLSAACAAEAGLAIAMHELGTNADWNLVLAGQIRSTVLATALGAPITLPDGTQTDLQSLTNLANCGHTAACTSAELDAFTTDRPWGANNPRWQVFGRGRIDQLVSGDVRVPPGDVVVWVADDPAELDGNPLRDSGWSADGARQPGAGLIVVRAEGFGIRAAHRVMTATLGRGPGIETARFVVAWREVR